MSKTLVFSESAAKAFGKLPPHVQEQLWTALFDYDGGRPSDVKRMSGLPGLRLRAGHYRVMFIENSDTLEIRAVGHRRDVYR